VPDFIALFFGDLCAAASFVTKQELTNDREQQI